jgi:protein-disulfide isomerase
MASLRERVGSASPRTLVAAAAGAAALLAVSLIAASLLGGGKGEASSSEAPVAASSGKPPLAAAGVEARELLRGIPQDGIVLGSPDAPVTLVEYADLQCPYCAQWSRDAFPAIVDEYVRPGKVKLLFRGLAFIGPESELALRAAHAAGRQDRLWTMVHALYGSQGPENGGWVTEGLLADLGRSVGADTDELLQGTSSAAVERELAAAERSAQIAGISGTPSFQVGRTGGALRPLSVSSLDASAFRPALDELLAG